MDHSLLTAGSAMDAVRGIVWVLIAILIGLVVQRVLSWTFERWAKRTGNPFAISVARRTKRPAAYVLPLVAILAVLPNIVLPPQWTHPVLHTVGLLVIAGLAWSMIALIRLWGDVVIAPHSVDVEDNLLARQLSTRVDILTRVGVTLVVIVAIGMMLMTFPEIRALGTTLLASAGLAGIVAGLAARPLFENLVAGIQLALTQPMRIDDVVIVEKQFGRIEEIHTTYVVVRLWDLRRMVVPLAYFINTPFENWTRKTANLLGEVYFFADYQVDIDALRAELPKILARTKLWDGQVQTVQVTDATEKTVQIRALVSARDSAELFDLRCFTREELIRFLRDHQPDALPLERTWQRDVTRRHDDPPDAKPAQNGAAHASNGAAPAASGATPAPDDGAARQDGVSTAKTANSDASAGRPQDGGTRATPPS